MKKQDGYYVESRQINFKNMIRWISKQLIFLLICAIIGAVLTVVWQYRRDYKLHLAAYENKIYEQQQKEETYETLANPLSDVEIRGVYTAFNYYKLIKEGTDYMGESLWMQINPYEEYEITTLYEPSGDAEKMKQNLELYLKGDEFLSALLEKVHWDTEKRYLGELLSCEAIDGKIQIKAVAQTKTQVEELDSAVQELIKGQYGSGLNVLNSQEQIVVDQQLVTQYNLLIQSLADNNVNYVAQSKTLSDNQVKLFQFIVARYNNQVIEEDSEEEAVLEPTYVNKKMGIVGIGIGIIAGIVILAVIYTFSAAVHGEEEIRHLYEQSILGKLQPKRNTIYPSQMERLVSEICYICNKEQKKKLLLSGSCTEKLVKNELQELQEKLTEKGFDVQCAESIVRDAEAFEKSTERSVLFVEISEKSKCIDIAEELNVCLKNEIDCVGIIMVEY